MNKFTVLHTLITMYDREKFLEEHYKEENMKLIEVSHRGSIMAIEEIAWTLGFTEKEFYDSLKKYQKEQKRIAHEEFVNEIRELMKNKMSRGISHESMPVLYQILPRKLNV